MTNVWYGDDPDADLASMSALIPSAAPMRNIFREVFSKADAISCCIV